MKKRWWLLFLFYLCLVFVGTLAVQGRSILEWVELLIPPGRLRAIFVYPLQHHHPVTFVKLLNLADTLLNIFLFFPLGVVIFLLCQRVFPSDAIRKMLFIALFTGLLLSVSIELFQSLVPKRVVSISDVIANTGGTVFGCYVLYFQKVYREKKNSTDHKR